MTDQASPVIKRYPLLIKSFQLAQPVPKYYTRQRETFKENSRKQLVQPVIADFYRLRFRSPLSKQKKTEF